MPHFPIERIMSQVTLCCCWLTVPVWHFSLLWFLFSLPLVHCTTCSVAAIVIAVINLLVAVSTFGFSLSFCETNCRVAVLPIATVVATVCCFQFSIRDTAIKWVPSLQCNCLNGGYNRVNAAKWSAFQREMVSLRKVHFEQLQTLQTHVFQQQKSTAAAKDAHNACVPFQ